MNVAKIASTNILFTWISCVRVYYTDGSCYLKNETFILGIVSIYGYLLELRVMYLVKAHYISQ
jgi:hypothetical protein